jgi:hypothetical protein
MTLSTSFGTLKKSLPQPEIKGPTCQPYQGTIATLTTHADFNFGCPAYCGSAKLGDTDGMEDEQPIVVVSTAEPGWQNTCTLLVEQRVALRVSGLSTGLQRTALNDIAHARGAKVIYAGHACAVVAP